MVIYLKSECSNLLSSCMAINMYMLGNPPTPNAVSMVFYSNYCVSMVIYMCMLVKSQCF